ncbi:MAG: hypothetical protein R3B70_03860 [Polyangiaceae bacterium]
MQLTLLPDGSSDRALLPLLRWLLRERSTAPFELTWADLRRLRQPPSKLADRVKAKDLLFSTLRTASNLSGRRLKKFDPDRFRLASLIEDFSPLRVLPSFRALEASLQSALLTLGVARNRP